MKPQRLAVPSRTAASVLALALGCAEPSEPTGSQAAAGVAAVRDLDPEVTDTERAEVVRAGNELAWDLYQQVRGQEQNQQKNLIYSPLSISLALAMTYAGARGETAQQMAQALSFTLAQERLHAALNWLDLELGRRTDTPVEAPAEPFQLQIANALWSEQQYSFLPAFENTLARHYGAGLQKVDFLGNAEGARVQINDWIADATRDRIRDLLPPGSVDPTTRLVLTNAIYFKASWLLPFDEALTQAEGRFRTAAGTEVIVPMMRQESMLAHADVAGLTAVELPYVGNQVSMVLLVPSSGTLAEREAQLNEVQVAQILAQLRVRNVLLTMPRFTFEWGDSLPAVLAALGMRDAFNPQVADFSGMDGTRSLFISEAVHKAFVAVDEQGTEAAAATGVVVGVTSAPPPPIEVRLDQPFAFLIRDRDTGATLFVGRVSNPQSRS